jgi:hypothetical protein
MEFQSEISLAKFLKLPFVSLEASTDQPLLGRAISEIINEKPFDLLYVSHSSLAWKSERPKMEHHETRVVSKNATIEKRSELLCALHNIVMNLHTKNISLLFHPYFYNKNGSLKSAKSPNLLVSRLSGDCRPDAHPSRATATECENSKLSDLGDVDIDAMYFQPESLGVYLVADVERYHDLVLTRINDKGTSDKADATLCIDEYHRMLRSAIANRAPDLGLDLTSFVVAGPVTSDPLGCFSEADDHLGSGGQYPLGMFWLFLWTSKSCRTEDNDSVEHNLSEIVRSIWFLLSAFYVRCLQVAEFSRGTEIPQTAFGHQIKGLGQFYGCWLKPVAEFDPLANHGQAKWTPAPYLFEDLGKTLTFWAFGNQSDDLCLDKKEDVPATLLDLIKLGCKFANQKERVKYYARKTDVSVLVAAKDYDPIEIVDERASESAQINQRKFCSLPTDDVNKCWRELAGLCRYLAILMENAYEYRIDKAKSQKVNVLIQLSEGTVCTIRLENECLSKEIRDIMDHDKRTRYSGARGKELLDFIEESSLSTLKNFKGEPDDRDSKFVFTVTFDLPSWIEKRSTGPR